MNQNFRPFYKTAKAGKAPKGLSSLARQALPVLLGQPLPVLVRGLPQERLFLLGRAGGGVEQGLGELGGLHRTSIGAQER